MIDLFVNMKYDDDGISQMYLYEWQIYNDGGLDVDYDDYIEAAEIIVASSFLVDHDDDYYYDHYQHYHYLNDNP